MAAVLMFSLVLFTLGFREDTIIVEGNTISIEGFYGETLTEAEIEEIALIDDLPIITMRTHGFALGEVRKGYFKTNKGERVKLILNSSQSKIILIRKKSGEQLYFSAKKDPNEQLYERIKQFELESQ